MGTEDLMEEMFKELATISHTLRLVTNTLQNHRIL